MTDRNDLLESLVANLHILHRIEEREGVGEPPLDFCDGFLHRYTSVCRAQVLWEIEPHRAHLSDVGKHNGDYLRKGGREGGGGKDNNSG